MVSNPADLPVAILAGGLATRLRPVTESIPKLLVEVAGEPFFKHQLDLLRESGMRRVVVCVGHLGEMIIDRFGDGSDIGMDIAYSHDGPKLLGTGGALMRALPLLGESFLVLYGDSYLPIDYMEVGRKFLSSGRKGLMTVYENRNQYDVSNVVYRDERIVAYDKRHQSPRMHHIDYGLGALRACVFDTYPHDTVLDLAAVYGKLVAENELAGFESPIRFFEIGSPAGLQELDRHLRSNPDQN
jgi:MurNAc alpha-1-phosphate uridylyltransferase